MNEQTKTCACKNLRSHDMYFRGADGDGFDCSSGVFWCLKTQTSLGPDGGDVDTSECQTGRTCFKG